MNWKFWQKDDTKVIQHFLATLHAAGLLVVPGTNPGINPGMNSGINPNTRFANRNASENATRGYSQSYSQAYQPGFREQAQTCHIGTLKLLKANKIPATFTGWNRGARHLSFSYRLRDPRSLRDFLGLGDELAGYVGLESVIVRRRLGLVMVQFWLPEQYWITYTLDQLGNSKAVGIGEGSGPVLFKFEDAPHAGLFGTSQCGKTELMKTVLASLMKSYTPNELGILVCDPYNKFGDFQNEAHLIAPIARDMNSIQTVIALAHKRMRDGENSGGPNAQRLVLAADESDKPQVGGNGSPGQPLLQELAMGGANFNVNLILIAQKPSEKNLPGIEPNLANRFAGKTSKGAYSIGTAGIADVPCDRLFGAGDFFHIANGDAVRFQVVQVTKQDYNRLERIEPAPLPVLAVPDDMPEPLNLPAPPTVNKGGRPTEAHLTVRGLLSYLIYGDSISQSFAQRELGFGKPMHHLHRDAAKEIRDECTRLLLDSGDDCRVTKEIADDLLVTLPQADWGVME